MKPKRHEDPELIEFIKKECPSIVDASPPPVDAHHLISRGAFGPDEYWNLMPLTRAQHVLCHQIGLSAFAKRYPSVRVWLRKAGWKFDKIRKKWRHN